MSLNLPSRVAKIGNGINTRSERHGDEDVAALDIPVAFVVEPIELCWLLKSEEAAHRLFIYSGNNVPGEKAFPAIAAIRLREKIEGANVNITFEGLMGNVSLDLIAKLAKISLEPLFSGKSNCSMTLQTVPDLDDTAILSLLSHMNGECQLTILVDGYNSQIGLPLPAPEEAVLEGDAA